MNQDRALKKVFPTDPGGTHTQQSSELSEDWSDPLQAEIYAEAVPPLHKHGASFINQRRKVRFLAEARLTDLSAQILKLADEIRYYDPLMAEALDAAWDATEAALDLMQED